MDKCVAVQNAKMTKMTERAGESTWEGEMFLIILDDGIILKM